MFKPRLSLGPLSDDSQSSSRRLSAPGFGQWVDTARPEPAERAERQLRRKDTSERLRISPANQRGKRQRAERRSSPGLALIRSPVSSSRANPREAAAGTLGLVASGAAGLRAQPGRTEQRRETRTGGTGHGPRPAPLRTAPIAACHQQSPGGARGGPAAPALNNSRAGRHVRRLEFNQAMEDFSTMFPRMDYDIIECVLRANRGAVDATIDQLLQMSLDGGDADDSSDSEESIPAEILERTLEPDSSDEEPPPVYSPPVREPPGSRGPCAAPTPPPRTEAPGSTRSRYRNWNPPLLGALPDDFLRIPARPPAGAQGSGEGRPAAPRGPGALEQERRWKQYLEDERIALFLQNEEFMKELQRNRDFLLALERDRLKYESKKSKSSSDFGVSSIISGDAAPAGSSEAGSAVSDDALFRDKLKHMGKSTRKKLFELARAFSEKTKMRKSKRKHLLKHHALGTAASTANLLDDVEGHSCGKSARGAGRPRRRHRP
ncbi:CUE domain-containing protein 1 [Nothoprocta perdicaria]|uniref:CUE domain-containing protein 1 n=1 Tax=Nothoprocta perdicaria TaxID=30464 RepID=UPI000E1B6F43|nr:CUE domain-containing protein 1 [Nothoprocta perdicaria]